MSKLVGNNTPFQWADLKDIDDVEPLNDADRQCLEVIRYVLEKHRKLARFGVMLIHEHFELEDDEVLVEFTDDRQRTLFIKPVKRSEVGRSIETNWIFAGDGIEAVTRCVVYCKVWASGAHCGEEHRKIETR
jgi:hypothetical protein